MNIVVNSRFNPFTYEQLIKPLEDYTKAYNEVEEQYANLAKQTETFRDVATRENSPEAYAMLNRYATDLENVIDDFSRGMTLANRKQLLGLKRRYAKEITPIARADAARQEALKYRRETRARDNSAIFKVENLSLDDFLHGRTVSEDYVSGKDILARTSAKAEALGKALFSDPEFKEALNGQKFQITQQNGMTPEMFYAVVNDQLNNPNISEALRTKLQGFRQIMNDELATVADWGENAKQQVLNSVTTGMYAGLAKPAYQFTENGEYINAAQRQSLANERARIAISQQQLALSREQFNYAKDKDKIASGTSPYYTSPDGKTKYYSNGKLQWTETQQSNGTWKQSNPTPVKSSSGSAPAKKMPTLYWHANNDGASNINSVSQSKSKTAADAEEIVSPSSLSVQHQNYIRSALAASGTGWTLDNVQVGIIRHWHKDDEYFLIPNLNADVSQVAEDSGDDGVGEGMD